MGLTRLSENVLDRHDAHCLSGGHYENGGAIADSAVHIR
jgi:hypothetical protein